MPRDLPAALGGAILLLHLSTGAGAELKYLDGIVAQVGKEIVLASEVEEQLAIASLRADIPDTSLDSAREQVLSRIIDEKVIVQEARARGISVGEEEVEQAVTQHIDLIRQRLGGDEAFERELAKEGLTREELFERYREEARRDLLYTRLIQREIYSKIEVSADEVADYFETHRSELPPKPGEVELAHVFIGVRPAESEIAAAEKRLDRVLKRLGEGEAFEEVAKALSDDAGSRERGGDLGWFEPGDLDPRLAEICAELEPGERSEPFQAPGAVQILRLIERDGERMHLQHILIGVELTEADQERARAAAERVAALARSGADFGALADEHSDDRDSAGKGGSLGTFNTAELNPAVALAVRELEVGQLTDVVETDQGFHVFKVLAREGGGEYELDDVRDRIRSRIVEERAAALTEGWLAGVRAKYFIRRADRNAGAHPAGAREGS